MYHLYISFIGNVYIPIVAATSGTLSIIAENTPKILITIYWFGIEFCNTVARYFKVPIFSVANVSNEATANKMPRKNKILDSSILERALNPEYK